MEVANYYETTKLENIWLRFILSTRSAFEVERVSSYSLSLLFYFLFWRVQSFCRRDVTQTMQLRKQGSGSKRLVWLLPAPLDGELRMMKPMLFSAHISVNEPRFFLFFQNLTCSNATLIDGVGP